MPFSQVNTGIRELLKDPEQRHDFFKAMTQDDIAEQIRDLRRKRGLTQKGFARISDMKQSAVSRIEQAEYSKWTLTTLFRVASALDGRWRMVLQPCEEAVQEFEGIDDQAAATLPAVTPAIEKAAAADAPIFVGNLGTTQSAVMTSNYDDLWDRLLSTNVYCFYSTTDNGALAQAAGQSGVMGLASNVRKVNVVGITTQGAAPTSAPLVPYCDPIAARRIADLEQKVAQLEEALSARSESAEATEDWRSHPMPPGVFGRQQLGMF